MADVVPFSVLDLAPVVEGGDAAQALRNSLDLARHAEARGYRRYWLAEHHGMAGVASAATAVVIAHVAGGTSTIRVGAGGIMLPNHAPLVIAEQFGTLESLFPGRIDLGVGRAPGTDPATAAALRRTLAGGADTFPQDVVELMEYFRGEPGRRVRAVPGDGLPVPLWILGSSLFGAQLAAQLGLPYAFASHFAPGALMQAIQVYRERFQPSEHLSAPYVMLGFNVFAADTDDEGQLLMTSVQQAFAALRRGRPGLLQPPMPDLLQQLNPMERLMLDEALACSAAGSPETVRRRLQSFIDRTQADELMITSQIFEDAARVRSYEITADVRETLSPARPGSAAA
jgi:luciferase family oxidoreductase group 1